MAHTPGPWTVQGQAVLSDKPYPEWEQIAEVRIGNAGNWSDPEGQANARLIAAAPELLAALRSIMELYFQGQIVIEGQPDDEDDPVVVAAMHAIAKAEGRSADHAVS